jgi:hypothetical protein
MDGILQSILQLWTVIQIVTLQWVRWGCSLRMVQGAKIGTRLVVTHCTYIRYLALSPCRRIQILSSVVLVDARSVCFILGETPSFTPGHNNW